MIQSISIHRTGNKLLDEPIRLSKESITLNDELQDILSQYFLSSFKTEEYYRFYHTINLSLNPVYTCISAVFDNPALLHEQSVHLAKHLYDKSTHPKIKGGEFYMVYFKDYHLNGETMDAIGLFKSENKDEDTPKITEYFNQVPEERFHEKFKLFGQYELTIINHILYFIDNEIHHRGQGFVYLRALQIEPPFFWDRY